jgi:hypothetical protein
MMSVVAAASWIAAALIWSFGSWFYGAAVALAAALVTLMAISAARRSRPSFITVATGLAWAMAGFLLATGATLAASVSVAAGAAYLAWGAGCLVSAAAVILRPHSGHQVLIAAAFLSVVVGVAIGLWAPRRNSCSASRPS